MLKSGKIISFMLVMAMVLSMGSVGFANVSKGGNLIIEQNDNMISKEVIQDIYQSQGKTMASETNGKALTSNANTDRDTLFENLEKIQELQLEDTVNQSEIDRLFDEIAELESVVEYNLEVNDGKIVSLSGALPNIPSSTRYLKSYGFTTDTTYRGKSYEVHQIVVYTTDSDPKNSRVNPLLYNDKIDLLAESGYSLSDFQKTVTGVADYVGGLFSIPYALYSSVIPSSSYFGSGKSQTLKYEHTTAQLLVYAYVADRGINWYEHKQTSERLSVASKIIALANSHGSIYDESKGVGTSHFYSDYYACVNNPTKLYHNNSVVYEYHRVDDIHIKYNDVYKGRIRTFTYPTVWHIPGL